VNSYSVCRIKDKFIAAGRLYETVKMQQNLIFGTMKMKGICTEWELSEIEIGDM
jgi:hypothetical protein